MSADTFDFTQGARDTLRGTLHDPAATTGHVLTVLPDKSIAAQPGGGGSGGVQVVTVPVSSAQILDLANTPVVIVPAIAGFVAQLQGYCAVFLEGTTPYTDNGGSVALQQFDVVTPINNVQALLAQGTDQIAAQGYGSSFDNPLAGYIGADIVVTLINGGANPTDGDGTLLVTLSYFLAPTV